MGFLNNILNDEMYDNLNNISRWNNHPRIKEESVAHHSYLVLFYGSLFLEDLKKDQGKVWNSNSFLQFELKLKNCLANHDFDETITSDILHTVKYNPHNGEIIRECLKEFVYSVLSGTESLTENSKNFLHKSMEGYYEHIIISYKKVFDWVACLFYINKEINMGNKTFLRERKYCVDSLKESVLILERNLEDQINKEITELLDLKKFDDFKNEILELQ